MAGEKSAAAPYTNELPGYREGGGALAALPLPRSGLAGWTAAVVASGLIALVAPYVLGLASLRGMPGFYMALKDGGVPAWALLVVHPFATVVAIVLGAFVVRGKASAPLLGLTALVPLLVAIAGVFYDDGRVVAAIAGDPIDAGTKVRVLAEGFSESDACAVLGSWSAAFVAAVGALACAASLVDVDVRRFVRPAGSVRAGTLVGGALAAVPLVARILAPSWRSGVSATVAFVVVLVATSLAGPALDRARAIAASDAKDVGRTIAAAFAAAVLFALAVFLFDRAAFFVAERSALGAVSGGSVDPSQKARILMEIAPGVAATRITMVVDVVAAAGAFVPALLAGRRGLALRSMSVPLAVALVAVLALAGAARARSTKHDLAKSKRHAADLPVALVSLGDEDGVDDVDVVVLADGTAKTIGALDASRPPIIAPDRHAAYAAVFGAHLGASSRAWLVGRASPSPADFPLLGDYARYVGPELTGWEVTLLPKLPSDVAEQPTLYVVALSRDEALLIRRARWIDTWKISLRESDEKERVDAIETRAKNVDSVVVAPMVDATVEDAYRLLHIASQAAWCARRSIARSTFAANIHVEIYAVREHDALLVAAPR